MNDLPSKEQLEKQHTEIVDNRALRDRILMVETYLTAALHQAKEGRDNCGDLDHMKDTKKSVSQLIELIKSGPLHELGKIQLTVDKRSVHKD